MKRRPITLRRRLQLRRFYWREARLGNAFFAHWWALFVDREDGEEITEWTPPECERHDYLDDEVF